MNRLKWRIAIAVVTVAAGTLSLAQERPDLEKMGAEMRKNQEELRQYSWETKLTFFVDDALRRVDVFKVRYVMNGMLEKMQIDSEVAKGAVRTPDGKKLKKKEVEAAREFVLAVKDQLDAYLNPLFAEKAVATASARTENGNLILKSRDVVSAGDSVVITLRQATRQPVTAEIRTSIEGSPVSLDVTFAALDYGPNYTAKSITTSEWRGIELKIVTENSNYVRRGG